MQGAKGKLQGKYMLAVQFSIETELNKMKTSGLLSTFNALKLFLKKHIN